MALEHSDVEILISSSESDANALPGSLLKGGFRLTMDASLAVKRMEASVLWYTEGRGNMDEELIWHQTYAEGLTLDSQQAFSFEVSLPERPWSYAGKLIKIIWVVRVRVFPEDGSDVVAEQRFLVGPVG